MQTEYGGLICSEKTDEVDQDLSSRSLSHLQTPVGFIKCTRAVNSLLQLQHSPLGDEATEQNPLQSGH